MSKISRLNSYHLVDNFPKDISIFRRILGNIIFFIFITKVTRRKNHLIKDDYVSSKALIKKGDIILVGGFRAISGIFMGKFFTHSLLYIGDNKCIHADADGVDLLPFEELFGQYDSLLILRPQIKNNYEQTIEKVINLAEQQIGKAYNFYFERREDRYICTELIVSVFKKTGVDLGVGPKKRDKKDWFRVFSRIKKAIKADDFLKGNLEMIFVSRRIKRKIKS